MLITRPQSPHAALLTAIYDTALNPARWADVLAQLAQMFRAHRIPMAASTPDRLRPRSVSTFGFEGESHQAYLDTWHANNVIGKRRPPTRAGDIMRTGDLMSQAQFTRTEQFQAYFNPRDMHEMMRLDIMADPLCHLSLTICRSSKAGAFARYELDLARAIIPHLVQAAEIGQRLASAELRSEAALMALEATGQSTIVLDGFARLVYASASAEEMLSRDGGLIFTPQGLRAATHAANLALARVLERALGSPGTRPVAGRLRLPRPSGSAALSSLIMPITPAHGWMLPGHPAVLLLLSDPAGIARPAHQHLMALYNLTMAEARLAVDLLDGQSLAEIARRRERSLSTIRTQLARLMAKTQTHRQSELVSKLARMTS